MAGGRPIKYETPELMEQAIGLYLQTCEAEKRKPTITRLALALGFESRQSFYDYEQKEEFSYIIKRARLEVEAGYEDGLRESNCTGSIFALKNMGWKDKTEQEISGGLGITWHEERTYETK
jgi:DNA-packaging protein gp3